MTTRARNKRKRGFTLIELLVAMVIVGILSVSIFLITTAAGDTFLRQRELVSADDVKDFVLTYAKQTISGARYVYLSNTLGDQVNGTVSTKLKSYNVLFSYEGEETTESGGTKTGEYAYVLEKNPDGLLYPNPDEQPEAGTLPKPTNATMILTVSMYDKYSVDLQFSVVRNAQYDKYMSVKITARVYTPSSESGVLGDICSSGSELVSFLNVQLIGGEVGYSGAAGDSYTYCYFYSE